jgi:hypothetical protein
VLVTLTLTLARWHSAHNLFVEAADTLKQSPQRRKFWLISPPRTSDHLTP